MRTGSSAEQLGFCPRRTCRERRPTTITDFTEHWASEAKLCLCAIKDVWSSGIVGYLINGRMKARLAVAAIDNAVPR